MVPSYWQSATVLVYLYFGSTLAFIESSCDHDQFCFRRSETSNERYSGRLKNSDREYRLSQRRDVDRLGFEIRLGVLTSPDRSETRFRSDRFDIEKVWREDRRSLDQTNRESAIRTNLENIEHYRDSAKRNDNSREIVNSRRNRRTLESGNDRLERNTRIELIQTINRVRLNSNERVEDAQIYRVRHAIRDNRRTENSRRSNPSNQLELRNFDMTRSDRVHRDSRSRRNFEKEPTRQTFSANRIEQNNRRATQNQLVRNRLGRTEARVNLDRESIIRATERINQRDLTTSNEMRSERFRIREDERRDTSARRAAEDHQSRRIDSLQEKHSTIVSRESRGHREDREESTHILDKRNTIPEDRRESREHRITRQVRNRNSESRRERTEELREALRVSNRIDSERRQRNERSRQNRRDPQESREESRRNTERNKDELVRFTQQTIKRNLERQIRSDEPRNRREQSRENSRLGRLAIHQERRIESSERSERRIQYSEIRRETSEELQDRRGSDIGIRRSVPEDRRQRVEQAQRRREVLEGPRRNIHDVVSNRREQVQTDRETFVDRRERTEMQRREENRSLERFSIRNNLVRSNRNEVDGQTKRIGALNNVVEELRLSLDRDMVRRNERSMHRLDSKIERFNIRSNINVDESQRVDRNHNDNQFYRSSERAHIDSRQNDRVERSGINRIEGNRRRLEQYRDQTRSLDLNKKSNGREDLRSAYNDHRMESTRTDREERKYTERNISKRTEFSPVRTQQNRNIGEEFGRNFALNTRSSVDTSIDSSRLVRDISSIKRLGPLSFRSIDNGESYVKKTADSTLMYQLIQAILMASIILSTLKRQDFPAKQKSKNWFLQKFSAIVNIY